MLLLKKDIIKKKQINKLFLEFKQEFKNSYNKKHKIKAIKNNGKKNLPGLYTWFNKKAIQKKKILIMHFQQIVSNFYKIYLKKLIVILTLLNSALSIVKLLIKFLAK